MSTCRLTCLPDMLVMQIKRLDRQLCDADKQRLRELCRGDKRVQTVLKPSGSLPLCVAQLLLDAAGYYVQACPEKYRGLTHKIIRPQIFDAGREGVVDVDLLLRSLLEDPKIGEVYCTHLDRKERSRESMKAFKSPMYANEIEALEVAMEAGGLTLKRLPNGLHRDTARYFFEHANDGARYLRYRRLCNAFLRVTPMKTLKAHRRMVKRTIGESIAIEGVFRLRIMSTPTRSGRLGIDNVVDQLSDRFHVLWADSPRLGTQGGGRLRFEAGVHAMVVSRHISAPVDCEREIAERLLGELVSGERCGRERVYKTKSHQLYVSPVRFLEALYPDLENWHIRDTQEVQIPAYFGGYEGQLSDYRGILEYAHSLAYEEAIA